MSTMDTGASPILAEPVQPPAPGDPRIGRVLQGRYRVVARVAEGAMGVVYQAERMTLGRPVAVKFLNAQLAADATLVKRFEVETRAMGALAHPNCVSVIDFGFDGTPYLVMDFVRGPSLRTLLDWGPLAPTRAIRLTRQILAALEHAHSHTIVHRDIKPENVLVEHAVGAEEHVRVVDFGLAKFLKSQLKITMGGVLGTPNYMAPELTREGPIDGRVDTYAASVVLFEMLTGQAPFDGADVGEIFARLLNTAPPPLREVQPDRGFSAELEAALLRSMAKNRDDRFPSAADFSAALGMVPESRADPVPSAPRPGSGPPIRPADALRAWWSRRRSVPADPGRTIVEDLPAFLRESGQASHQRLPRLRTSWGNVRAKVRGISLRSAEVFGSLGRASVGRATDLWRGIARLPKRLIVASLGAATILTALAMVILLLADGDPPAGSPAAVARATSMRSQGTASAPTARAEVPRAGDAETIPRLLQLRRAEPRNAQHAATLSRLYFEKGWWTDGFAAYRAASELDPKLRSDPALVKHLVSALRSDKIGSDVVAHLRRLGPAARPHLQAAARSHPSPRVRARAAEILKPSQHRSSGRWFTEK